MNKKILLLFFLPLCLFPVNKRKKRFFLGDIVARPFSTTSSDFDWDLSRSDVARCALLLEQGKQERIREQVEEARQVEQRARDFFAKAEKESLKQETQERVVPTQRVSFLFKMADDFLFSEDTND